MTPNAKRVIFLKFLFSSNLSECASCEKLIFRLAGCHCPLFQSVRFGVIELGLFFFRLKHIFRIVLERATLSTWWFVLVRDTVSQLVVEIESSQPLSVFNALAFLICVTGLLLYLNKDTAHYHLILSTRLALVRTNQSTNQPVNQPINQPTNNTWLQIKILNHLNCSKCVSITKC